MSCRNSCNSRIICFLNWAEICKDSEVLESKNVKCLKINGQTGESRTKINRNVTYMYTLKVQYTKNMQIVLKSIHWQSDIVWQYLLINLSAIKPLNLYFM